MSTNRARRLVVESLESRCVLSTITPLAPVAGDANLDGRFDATDLVQVWQAGKYQTEEVATWSEGDWTNDGMFNERDLVAAFQTGTYGQVAAARATKIYIDGTSVRIAVLNQGNPTFPGPNLHIRKFVSQWRDEASDPRLTGRTTVYVKLINLADPATGAGHLPGGGIHFQGTYETEVGTWNGDDFTPNPTGGIWRGNWTGKSVGGNESLLLVGHGSGGDIEGLKARLTFAADPSGAVLTGYMLDPGKK